ERSASCGRPTTGGGRHLCLLPGIPGCRAVPASYELVGQGELRARRLQHVQVVSLGPGCLLVLHDVLLRLCPVHPRSAWTDPAARAAAEAPATPKQPGQPEPEPAATTIADQVGAPGPLSPGGPASARGVHVARGGRSRWTGQREQ